MGDDQLAGLQHFLETRQFPGISEALVSEALAVLEANGIKAGALASCLLALHGACLRMSPCSSLFLLPT